MNVENVQSLLSARPIWLLSVNINVTECIVCVSGYDLLTFLSCPSRFLIGGVEGGGGLRYYDRVCDEFSVRFLFKGEIPGLVSLFYSGCEPDWPTQL